MQGKEDIYREISKSARTSSGIAGGLGERPSWFPDPSFAYFLESAEHTSGELDGQHRRLRTLVDCKFESGAPEVTDGSEQQRGVNKAIRPNCTRQPQNAL